MANINTFGPQAGILIPLTTPFKNESVDVAALESNIAKWKGRGLTGFVMLGSTGERVHLSESEYAQVVETSRRVTPSDLHFIVGAGQQSTFGTIREVKKAAELGADACLVLTPHFYRSAITQEALINFFTAVADAGTVPIFLYSMPALTGIKIEPETIARLSEHPNIIGVKDSSNDMVGFAETRKMCSETFAVITGNGTVLLDALKAGATGGILAVGCAVPELCVDIYNSFHNDERDRAEQLQALLTPLAAAVTTRFGIGGLKAALDFAGYIGGEVRSPLSPPNEESRAEINTLLISANSSSQATAA